MRSNMNLMIALLTPNTWRLSVPGLADIPPEISSQKEKVWRPLFCSLFSLCCCIPENISRASIARANHIQMHELFSKRSAAFVFALSSISLRLQYRGNQHQRIHWRIRIVTQKFTFAKISHLFCITMKCFGRIWRWHTIRGGGSFVFQFDHFGTFLLVLLKLLSDFYSLQV